MGAIVNACSCSDDKDYETRGELLVDTNTDIKKLQNNRVMDPEMAEQLDTSHNNY